jgi:hypothetical protein
MSAKLLGVDIFRVDSVQQHELGMQARDVRGGEGQFSFKEVIDGTTQFRRFDPAGEYRYVKGGTGGVAEGVAVAIETGATDTIVPYQVINMTAEGVIEGVPLAAIPANSFGWIQINGKHYNLNVLDAVADDALLEPGAGPSLIAATLDIAHYAASLGGVSIRKIADATSLGGAANRGIGTIRP